MTSTVSTARPATVTASFYLWLITVLFGLIGAVLLFILSGSAQVAGTKDAPVIPGVGKPPPTRPGPTVGGKK